MAGSDICAAPLMLSPTNQSSHPRRTFIYARTDPDPNNGYPESHQMHALESCVADMVSAMQLPLSSYMYAVEIATAQDYSRAGFDALLGLVTTRRIDTIILPSANSLCTADGFALFARLCNRCQVSITCLHGQTAESK